MDWIVITTLALVLIIKNIAFGSYCWPFRNII